MTGNGSMTLSVVIPVYNEKDTLSEILLRVESQPTVHEIIVVDDGSTDGSRELLRRYEGRDRYHILFHQENRGKGAALRTGFRVARSDLVMVQDADLEYDPSDYPALLDPILSGHADVVMGSRFLGGPHRVLYFWHYAGNRFLTLLSNVCNNLNLSDMEVCYKVFKRGILDRIQLRSNRFGFEPEFTAKVARAGLRIYEVPVRYYGRTYAEGKKIGWKDGIAALFWIVRYRLFD